MSDKYDKAIEYLTAHPNQIKEAWNNPDIHLAGCLFNVAGRGRDRYMENSLLLYLETCAVDRGGVVDGRRMNSSEFELAERWNKNGYVQFGRISFKDIGQALPPFLTHWCKLSEKAWVDAHRLRLERAKRMYSNRIWKKSTEG